MSAIPPPHISIGSIYQYQLAYPLSEHGVLPIGFAVALVTLVYRGGIFAKM